MLKKKDYDGVEYFNFDEKPVYNKIKNQFITMILLLLMKHQ